VAQRNCSGFSLLEAQGYTLTSVKVLLKASLFFSSLLIVLWYLSPCIPSCYCLLLTISLGAIGAILVYFSYLIIFKKLCPWVCSTGLNMNLLLCQLGLRKDTSLTSFLPLEFPDNSKVHTGSQDIIFPNSLSNFVFTEIQKFTK